MADPLSIAGSVVGIISLGIQAAESLVQYYTSFRDQEDDIANVVRKLKSLLELLKGFDHEKTQTRIRKGSTTM